MGPPEALSVDRKRTFLYFSSFVCMGLAVGVIGPILPKLKQQAGDSGAAMSPSFIARGVGGLAGSLGGGWLVDHFPGHFVVAGSICIMATALATLVVCSGAWQLAATFALFDTATGGLQSVNALMVWTVPDCATSMLNTLNGCFGVGTLLAPLLPLALGAGHERLSAWLIAIGLLPTAAAAMSLPSPARPAPRRGDDEGAQPNEARPLTGSLSAEWRRTVLIGLTAFFLMMVVGAETTMGAFLVTYVEGMAGAGRLLASGGGAGDSDGGGDGGDGVPGQAQGELLTSAFWVSFTAGRFVNGAASARFRPAVILLAELALLNTSILLVVLAPRSAGALWVGVLGCGLGLSGCYGGAVGQVQSLVGLTGRMGGVFGAGALAGVSTVQLAASRASDDRPEAIMRIIGGASFGAAVAMMLTWAFVGGGDFSLEPPESSGGRRGDAGGGRRGGQRRRLQQPAAGGAAGDDGGPQGDDGDGDNADADDVEGEEMGLLPAR